MKQGLMMLAHGSKVQETDETMTQYVEAIKTKAHFDYVEKAYLQLMDPDMDHAVENLYKEGVRKIFVFPFFLFSGNHILEDIPAELDRIQTTYSDVEFVYMKNIGFDNKLVEMILNRMDALK